MLLLLGGAWNSITPLNLLYPCFEHQPSFATRHVFLSGHRIEIADHWDTVRSAPNCSLLVADDLQSGST